jgi:4-amino-4-deoxychorismate lyase
MKGLRECLVDGELSTESWPQDRALQYGDGLFETTLVRDGRIRFARLHQARLQQGCARLGIAANHAALWSQAQALAHQHGHAILKLLVTRGSATSRGYGPARDEAPRSVITVFDPPAAQELPATIAVNTLTSTLGENPALAGMKHCNRLEQIMARGELARTDGFEGLLYSSAGRLVSGTTSNVFLEQAGTLVTPVLDRCGIAGVMRAVALREAPPLGLQLRVADISAAAVRQCSGMFITNIRLGVLPVQTLDGRALAISDGVRNLAARIRGLDA